MGSTQTKKAVMKAAAASEACVAGLPVTLSHDWAGLPILNKEARATDEIRSAKEVTE